MKKKKERVRMRRLDTRNELRVRLSLSMILPEGHRFFNEPVPTLVGATLMPDGKTLDVTLRIDAIKKFFASIGDSTPLYNNLSDDGKPFDRLCTWCLCPESEGIQTPCCAPDGDGHIFPA